MQHVGVVFVESKVGKRGMDVGLHYQQNAETLVKRLTNRAGGVHNAEDIVQEAYARALKYRDTYDPDKGGWDQWMSMLLRNAEHDFKNKERRQGMSDGFVEEDYHIDTLGMLERDFEVLIKHRDEFHKDILRLYFIKGLWQKDIIALTGARPAQVNGCVAQFNREAEGFG